VQAQGTSAQEAARAGHPANSSELEKIEPRGGHVALAKKKKLLTVQSKDGWEGEVQLEREEDTTQLNCFLYSVA